MGIVRLKIYIFYYKVVTFLDDKNKKFINLIGGSSFERGDGGFRTSLTRG